MNNEKESVQADSQTILNQIVLEYMQERKRQRIGRYIFRGLILFILLMILFFSLRNLPAEVRAKPHVGYIEISGEIGEHKEASGENIVKGIVNAYRSQGLK